ncbi:amino acid/polyamine/organocation transporter, APC superfamily [Actinacidiphila yanglinensis]|uniref:Amino acid/polyamine/organocation transporter, APC superfamily n=1 Tax=Actinacidiphila yanglinensis TaxID=310779 RepID=A0A1H5ZY09_9ACTN|nr:APC family permease [Actinacidiphila yanglinensis]SEG40577.1 amino acid/polyamine/organocation transporter, APC superfamily [Actinacidiphila yanglinensis]
MVETTKPTVGSPDDGAAGGTRLRRDMGRVSLLFAGVGSIIGSGWLFGALNAARIAGPASIFSWAIAAVMILLIGLCFAELGTMFPVSGGVVRFPHLSFGSFASYTMGWITWVAAATVAPIEVEGALQYATKWADFTQPHANGSHTLTGLGYLVAVLGMAFFVTLNYFGIRWFARVNNVLVWWKLAIILTVVLAFLFTAFHGHNFSAKEYGGFAPGGAKGVFTAISTAGITFSFLGFRQAVELAGETDDPKRNVPFAIIGSVLLTGAIYVALEVAFLAAVPGHDLRSSGGWLSLQFANDFGPLAAIAGAIGLGWLAYLLYVDAVISPADTGLIYTTVTARISYAMARNGNAPKQLSATTSRGAPLVSLIVTFVLGLIVFLPFPSWQQLVGFITSATVLSFGSGPLVLAALRRQVPEQERPFRVPGGDVIPFLGLYSANLIVYWAGWNTNWKLFATIGIGFVLLAVFEATSRETPDLEWRAGATWVMPWLIGLALVSWAGDYDGGRGWIGLGWGFVVNLALAAIVYLLALRVRLPEPTVRAHIAHAVEEAEAEQAELGATP